MARRSVFATTWWGESWITALEDSARLDPNRLGRGRTYARQGAVSGLTIEAGMIRARVSGSHGRYYRTEINVRTIPTEGWDDVAAAVASRAVHAAALADGELDPVIVDDARAVGVELMPGPGDLRPHCSCPDWAELCKHAAAVCYLVGAEFDRDPASLFLLRGLSRDQLAELLRTRRDGELDDDSAARFGVVAKQAWAEHGLDDVLESFPVGPRAPRHPGRVVPWEGQVPVGDPVDPRRTTELAHDATIRAWAMLVDGAPSALHLTARGDIARRAASCVTTRELEVLAARARLTVVALRAWLDAWALAGDDGVEVVADSDSWSIDQELLSAGRDALVELGVPKRSVALNYDSLGMPRGIKLVIGHDGRWYRLESRGGKRGLADQLHLADVPSTDITDLVDAPPTS